MERACLLTEKQKETGEQRKREGGKDRLTDTEKMGEQRILNCDNLRSSSDDTFFHLTVLIMMTASFAQPSPGFLWDGEGKTVQKSVYHKMCDYMKLIHGWVEDV